MPRSVQVHPDHKQTLATALERNGFLTQGSLAAHLEIATSTVSNFFRGVKVSARKFEEIAETLGLNPSTLIKPRDSGHEAPHPNLHLDPTPFQTPFFSYDTAWVGRAPLISDLKHRLLESCRLLILNGIAGIGKTALAERLTLELQPLWLHQDSSRLLRENFDNREQSTDFGSVAARLLEKTGQVITPEARRNTDQLRERLIYQLQNHAYLLVIDSLEEILQGNESEGWSEFKDQQFVRFFLQILSTETFQTRIILTSQEQPNQILEMGSRYQNFWFCQTLPGLSESEQLALFDNTGLNVAPESDDRALLRRIGKAYEGHPLALRIIAGEIGTRPFFGRVDIYWSKYGQEIETIEQAIAQAEIGQTTSPEDQWRLDRFTRKLRRNVRQRLEQTFQRLKQDAKFAYILLCESSVYRCPVLEEWWLSHLEDWDCDEETQWSTLEILRDRFLIEDVISQHKLLVRQHNLIRSVSLDHLKQLELDPEKN